MKIVYVVLFAALAAGAVLRPVGAWDGLAYMATAGAPHAYVYQHASNVVDDNAYTRDLASSPQHFAEQMPFYTVKALFVIAVRAAAHVVPLHMAAAVVSGVSYFLLALLVLHWIGDWLLAAIAMLLPPVLMLARYPTPDCMALAGIAAGMYLITRGRDFWGAAVLVVCVWLRPDVLILCSVILLWMVWKRRLAVADVASLGVLAAGSYLVINRMAGSYGWATLIYHSLVQHLVNPGEVRVAIAPALYLKFLVRGLPTLLLNDGFALALLTAALLWPARQRTVVQLAYGAVIARLIAYPAYPNPDPRYSAAATFMVCIALLDVYRSARQTARNACAEVVAEETARV